MSARFATSLVTFLAFLTVQSAANAQTSDLRRTIDRINLSTVTIVGGDINSISARLVHDMGTVLNDGERQRVLPVLGLNDVQAISDVLHLRGIDIGLVHEDALDSIGQHDVFPNVKDRLVHIARLSQDNVYIIARDTVEDIFQLTGRKVGVGPGSPSRHTTPVLLLQSHGIDAELVNLDHADAIEQIRNGTLAATVIVGGDLKNITAGIGPGDGLRLLAVPVPATSAAYVPVTLTSEDLPSIIPAGTSLDTVSVSLIMIINNWPSSHPRYQKTARFVEALFSRIDEFHKPIRHAKWQDVNLAAEVANWTRFQPARDWLDQNEYLRDERVAKLQGFFDDFLARRDDQTELSQEQRDVMYREFLSWPNNPIETEITVRKINDKGAGEKLGTITVRNTEIMVLGRNEPALLIKPNLKGLKPGPYAFHIHQNPTCGPGEKDGRAVAGLAAGGHLWLAGTGDREGQTFASHLGDLPDLVVDADGTATKEVVVARLSLADAANRAIMIHGSQDDASPRFACGVIK